MNAIRFEDGLELLREHDIRVVRTRVVTSDEDAIGFAARRSIDLYGLASSDATLPQEVESDLRTTESIRHAYRRLEERAYDRPMGRILARSSPDDGSDVVVEARSDARLGRIVEIRNGTHSAHRLQPLGQVQGEAMIGEFLGKLRIESVDTRTRMLAHLVLRVSEIFENPAIERMTLDPVRLSGNSYVVVAARVIAKRGIPLTRRLGHHAHDRKALYAV